MFGKFLSALIETAKLPIDLVNDITDPKIDNSSHIGNRVKKVQRKLESMDE